jgi:hypothetical protein
MKKSNKKKIIKHVKAKVRKDFIEQGANDGRYKTKVVPNKKKKYNRRKAKKTEE